MLRSLLSTHYYLKDESHAMNALIANKCEKEVLDSIIIIADFLNVSDSVRIEKLANKEGGLVEWYQTLSYSDQIATLTLLVAIIGCYFTASPRKLNSQIKNKELNNKNIELDNVKKELEIKKLRVELGEKIKELNDDYSKTERQLDISEDERFSELKDLCLKALQKNTKLRRKQANFYGNLINCNKVKAVGFASYDENIRPLSEEKIVVSENFGDFLLDTDEDFEVIENAKIAIISPILTKNRSKWRGYLVDHDIIIKFYMKDKGFKKDIDDKIINFKSGSTINVVLTIKTKYDEFGEEVSKTYEVETVLEYTVDSKLFERIQGINYKPNKKEKGKQQKFDF